jgi:hypothetical protein
MSTEVASELEMHVADRINASRAEVGLPELKVEAHLNASAQGHSDWMASEGTLSHIGEDGSTATERIEDTGLPLSGDWRTAENIGYLSVTGDLDEAELDRLHEGLMESAGHRANMLDPQVSYVGIGLSVGNLPGSDQDVVFLTENFADTDGQVLVQEEVGGETVFQPYEDGEPVGDAEAPPDDAYNPDDGPDSPDDPASPEEEDEQEAATASAGGCFVATAAYGSYWHPDVVRLRRFRDEVLVNHPFGRAFIRAYLVIGPKLACLVSPQGRSGRVARALISPLARRAEAWANRR